jgi:branched-chain amino acid transport system substrate-binding protein
LKKYVTDYEARYKSEPGTFGGHAYDALMIVVAALKNVGPDKKKSEITLKIKLKTGLAQEVFLICLLLITVDLI